MAQLKDTVVAGSLRVTDTIYGDTIRLTAISAPTSSNGTTYDFGTNGYVIKSNGASVYWASIGSASGYGVKDATANGALGTGTGLTTERAVYYGLVTVNNASQTRVTGIYAPTSAGTANQILVSAGGTAAPTWKATANGAAYATSSNGALTFGTLPVAQGGTGATAAAGARTNLGLGSFATKSSLAWNEITQSGANSINQGSSDVTASTEIFTSYASNNGFSDSNSLGVVYRRAASKVVNATLVKAALGTVSTTAKKFLKDTGSWVQVDWGDLTNKPTTISDYGITDAKIASGVITLGSNTITPLTASSTLNATKLSGTIPTSCYTNSRDAGYGGIAPTNSTAVTALTGNTTATAAKTYNETLKVIAKNKWVVFAGSNSSTAGSDELQVAHALSGVTAGTSSPSSAQTPGHNTTFNIPTITVDAAGHVTAMSTTTVQIPAIPTASDSVAGITKVGASGGAAAYSHGTHVTTATVKTALGTDSTATTFLRKDGTWSNILSTSSTTLTDNASLSFAKTSINLKNSNNNVSSGESYLGSLLFTDANSLPAGALQTIVNTTGQSVLSLMALAYNSSGTAVVSPALQIIANKDGSNGYYVNNPAAFRMAINVPDSFDYLPLSGGTMAGQITTTASTQSTAVIKPNSNQYGTIGSSTLEYYGIYANTTISSVIRARNYEPKADTGSDRGMYYGFSYCSGHYYYINAAGSGNGTFVSYIDSNGVHAAVWNDFAEYRKSNIIEPGRVVVEDINDTMVLATERLQPCAKIISDTFGMSVGKSDKANTPIGVAGRVLAYTYQNRNNYHIGDCVCSAPNGTVDIMSREEIKEFPDRIIGIVSQIPNYELWENTITDNTGRVSKSTPIEVKNRIWIYVK